VGGEKGLGFAEALTRHGREQTGSVIGQPLLDSRGSVARAEVCTVFMGCEFVRRGGVSGGVWTVFIELRRERLWVLAVIALTDHEDLVDADMGLYLTYAAWPFDLHTVDCGGLSDPEM
jgi:hypothetical protein